ncbi:MAG TPA: aldo/keto reductase [Burkholderiaceae bacterium]|nr:aldo/keto reductase [Burkholderiaceae bacterium]
MQERLFGPTERRFGVIGQGTWNIEAASRRSAVSALQQGLELGMRHIDTAEMYGSGAAETIVAEAIAGRREQAFLVSKVLPGNASLKGTRHACEQSLKRLRTDHLDCYLLHWRGDHPLEETFAALDALQREGKILSFGVSNFDVADLEEAEAIVGPGRLACNQVLYHLHERAIEHEVIPWCEQRGIAVVAYSPFGHDDFPGPGSAGAKVLEDIAQANEATPRQIALAFLVRHQALFAIPKASRPEHARDNAAAGSIKLNGEEIAKIDAAFPRGPKPKYLPVI